MTTGLGEGQKWRDSSGWVDGRFLMTISLENTSQNLDGDHRNEGEKVQAAKAQVGLSKVWDFIFFWFWHRPPMYPWSSHLTSPCICEMEGIRLVPLLSEGFEGKTAGSERLW